MKIMKLGDFTSGLFVHVNTSIGKISNKHNNEIYWAYNIGIIINSPYKCILMKREDGTYFHIVQSGECKLVEDGKGGHFGHFISSYSTVNKIDIDLLNI